MSAVFLRLMEASSKIHQGDSDLRVPELSVSALFSHAGGGESHNFSRRFFDSHKKVVMSDPVPLAQNPTPGPTLPQPLALRLRAAETETLERFQMIVRRERSYLTQVEQAKAASGWFGSFHRAVTLSDPYEIEAKRSRCVIGSAEHGSELVAQSTKSPDLRREIELLNGARRLAGLRELSPGTLLPKSGDHVSFGLNKPQTDQEHFATEQAAITVSRDVAIAAAVAAGSVAGSALVGLFAKTSTTAATVTLGTQVVQDATMSASIAFTASTARAVDDVTRGAQTTNQAVAEVAKTTLWAAATGGIFGAVCHGCQSLFARIRPAVTQQRPTGAGLPKPKVSVNESPEVGGERPRR
ncbi:MAG: hypothetical protein U0136_12820 [Bdellovibrionota bacterium]